MDTQILTTLMQSVIAPLLAGFVFAARLKDPAGTGADIAAEAEGQVKHFLRGKLSFLIDILWEMPQFRQPLDAEIAAAVRENKVPEALTALLSSPSALLKPLAPAPAAPAASIIDTAAPLVLSGSGTFSQEEAH